MLLPVLVRVFRRFGQNERSLFSFLFSNEPFGLQAFSANSIDKSQLYSRHNFYDYVRANFGHRLSVQSYRSHWNLIDSVVDSFATDDELQLKTLKTIGLLNLINDNDLLASAESIISSNTILRPGILDTILFTIAPFHSSALCLRIMMIPPLTAGSSLRCVRLWLIARLHCASRRVAKLRRVKLGSSESHNPSAQLQIWCKRFTAGIGSVNTRPN